MEFIVDPNEFKQSAVKKALHFWYIIVIVLLLAFSVGTWQHGQNLKTDLAVEKNKNNIIATIEQLDAQLKDMEKRRAELYPELAKQQAELERQQKELEKKRKGLSNVKKDKIATEINKMDIDQLNNELGRLGYTSKVGSR
jgi:TolA-binding protein